MRRLITDLLTFARVTSKAQPFVRVELGDMVRDVLTDLDVAIEQSGAHITVGELPALEADPTQLRQLVQNLLSNALKFRREGVKPSSLSSLRWTQGAPPRAAAPGNGIGFDESDREQIFDLFHRLHSSEKYEGSGLGLALCRKIVERHGGTIEARSSLGTAPPSRSRFRSNTGSRERLSTPNHRRARPLHATWPGLSAHAAGHRARSMRARNPAWRSGAGRR